MALCFALALALNLSTTIKPESGMLEAWGYE
eukprot:CAMPEP_0183370124 /NCGR_PEP_ID=MMETSP0164_2-20130417/101540_1 /TAXON_ID=221442 /ORGANISM="Coccolithus pelagicus ssp braarudi, Strain PLY182g" /LENGTH=30 /DNA_ID= /DNA_START= /DNA_END= /DNA_ORIENTATION=